MLIVTPPLALIVFGAGAVTGSPGALLGIGGGVFLVLFLNLALNFSFTAPCPLCLCDSVAHSSPCPLCLRGHVESQRGVAFLARDERKRAEHVFELDGAELIELGDSRV